LSQFLSPGTNKRRDRFGGSLENRARLPLSVVERVRAALPPEMPVLAKVNLRDGFRGGLELDESVQVARWLEARGADALVLSGGFVSRNPFYLFRGERPLRQMIAVEKSWAQKLALALFGPALIHAYPLSRSISCPWRARCGVGCACRWSSWAASSRRTIWTWRCARASSWPPWGAR